MANFKNPFSIVLLFCGFLSLKQQFFQMCQMYKECLELTHRLDTSSLTLVVIKYRIHYQRMSVVLLNVKFNRILRNMYRAFQFLVMYIGLPRSVLFILQNVSCVILSSLLAKITCSHVKHFLLCFSLLRFILDVSSAVFSDV